MISTLTAVRQRWIALEDYERYLLLQLNDCLNTCLKPVDGGVLRDFLKLKEEKYTCVQEGNKSTTYDIALSSCYKSS